MAGFRGADVSGLLAALTPAAVLLSDDPDGAVRLLSVTVRGRRAAASAEAALRALVRAAVHRPGWAAEQVIQSWPPTGWDDADVALAGAWDALDVADRAAVVLEQVAGLPPTIVGLAGSGPGAARLREALARRDDDERRERARTAALYRRPGTAPEPDPAIPDLPERLTRLAAGRPLPDTAAGTITGEIRSGRRARRRRTLALAAGAVAAAVLLAVVPLLPRAPVPAGPVSVYAGPTRGSLAGDADFLRAMRHEGWALAAETPGPRRVVFAGDVPGDRWALVAAGGSPDHPATTAWFTGPAGAPPDRMSLLSIRVRPDPAEPVSVTDPATGALLIVGGAADQMLVSDRPVVGEGGAITRSFRPVPASRGVAVVGVAPIPHARVTAVRLQVTRGERRLAVPPPIVVAELGAPPVDVPTSRLRPPPAPATGDAAVAPRLRAVLGQLGRAAGDTPVTALWSGDLPGPNDQAARLTVVGIPQPSGAVVVTTPYGYAADLHGQVGSSWCGTGVLPAGLPLQERVVAVLCDLSDLSDDPEVSRFLVVVAPRTATSAQLLDPSGAVLGQRPLTDGVAVVRSPGDVAQVSVTTADGGTTSAVPLVDADLAG